MKHEHSGKLCLGYRCRCGRRVAVLWIKPGAPIAVQREITATCPDGHTSTLKADTLTLMDPVGDGEDN